MCTENGETMSNIVEQTSAVKKSFYVRASIMSTLSHIRPSIIIIITIVYYCNYNKSLKHTQYYILLLLSMAIR